MSLFNKSFIILFSLFPIIISIDNDTIIIFPFKIISKINGTNLNNVTLVKNYNSSIFYLQHYIYKILSFIKMGNPPQDVIAYIKPQSDSLLIGELEISNNIYSNYFYKGYQYNASSSFINISYQNNSNNEDLPTTFLGQENLYLYTKFNNIKENIYSLIYHCNFKIENQIIYNKNNIYGLNIGLSLDEYNFETNFMKQMHDRNIISSYIISFEFKNENEGIIIIGKYLHELFPEKYSQNQFKSFYSHQPRTMYLTNFIIEFNEIYSYKNNEKFYLQKSTKSNIILNSGVIIGTNEYMQFINNNFFSKYYKDNICELYSTGESFDSFIIFSCDDDKRFKLEEFPSLNFNIKSENLTFEFTYNDLFKKINNRYYFLIIFERSMSGYWRFGTPLYLKYSFVYNGDAKTIGFYQKKNNEEKSNDKNNNNWKIELNFIKIVVIIILFLIFISSVIIISYYFGKKCNFKKKKHANELDDNYDYSSPLPINGS